MPVSPWTIPADRRSLAYLDNVVRASERAAHLTQQLLAYSGKGRFVIQPLDLSALTRKIAALLRTSIPKQVELRLDLAPNCRRGRRTPANCSSSS